MFGVQSCLRSFARSLFPLTACLVLVACGMSEEFRREAGYAYHLVADSDHSHLLKRDVESAMARASASARTEADKQALSSLSIYVTVVEGHDGTPEEKRLVRVCQWEAAHRLQTNEPYFVPDYGPKPEEGECGKLFTQKIDHDIAQSKCEDQTVQPLRDQETAITNEVVRGRRPIPMKRLHELEVQIERAKGECRKMTATGATK